MGVYVVLGVWDMKAYECVSIWACMCAAILFSCQGWTTMPATAIACRTGPSETGSDCLFVLFFWCAFCCCLCQCVRVRACVCVCVCTPQTIFFFTQNKTKQQQQQQRIWRIGTWNRYDRTVHQAINQQTRFSAEIGLKLLLVLWGHLACSCVLGVSGYAP